jgi:hypothetical protein
VASNQLIWATGNPVPMFDATTSSTWTIATELYTTGKRTPDNSPELKDQRDASVLYVPGL